VVACGCCLGPADIPQSVIQASAAAARASEIVLA
jgi:heterodisulfide reductase subunit A-like polyferredoxin